MSAPWWVPRTFVLGLAALSTQMLAALYNAYLPIFYGAFVASNLVIGLIMIVDNIATLTVQPYFASLSDRVDTPLGRRMPFLLIGMPIAALAFLLIPRGQDFLPLFLATVMVNIGGAIFSSPSYALMPDITPPPLRSRANGIINAMSGLGALIAFFYLSKLYRQSRTLPFDLAAVLMVAALVIILLAIRERRLSVLYRDAHTPAASSDSVQAGRILPAARMIVQNRDRTILFLMLSALAWVAAVNGIQNMFTRYGMQHLGLDPSGATYLLGFYAVAFIAFSIPGGFIGDRIGRLNAIRLGAAGTLGALVAVSVIREPALFRIILIAAGLCWALAITNAYPFLVDRVPANQAGTFTGLWNATIGLAGLISPPIYGLVVDTFGFGAFFIPGIVFMAVGLGCTLGITEGSGGIDADAS